MFLNVIIIIEMIVFLLALLYELCTTSTIVNNEEDE
jgi:hypothetical protein